MANQKSAVAITKLDKISSQLWNREELFENVLFIDPGITGTGLAFWNEFNFKRPTIARACFPARSANGWLESAHNLTSQIVSFVHAHSVAYAFVEGQSMWSGNLKSFTSASKGEIFKLATFTGILIGRLCDSLSYPQVARDDNIWTPHTRIAYVPVQVWKGQLSKEAVDLRTKRLLHITYPEHVSDAVGMALAKRGLL